MCPVTVVGTHFVPSVSNFFSFLPFFFSPSLRATTRAKTCPASMVGGRETRLCIVMLFMMTLSSYIFVVAADELPRSSNPFIVLLIPQFADDV